MTVKGLIAYANSTPSILRNCQNFEKVSSLKVFIGLADEVYSLQERGRKIIQRTIETSDNVAYSPRYWRLAEINFLDNAIFLIFASVILQPRLRVDVSYRSVLTFL